MDPQISGALILLTGIGIGSGMTSAWYRIVRKRQDTKPICGCGHHRSLHKGGGACNWHGFRTVNLRDIGVSCTCEEYVGPVPLGQFWSPPMLK